MLNYNSLCFLCKKPSLTTDEHVFPQWLLDGYNIRHKYVALKNGTKFKYGNVVVPCCAQCNNEHLSNIENSISKAIKTNDLSYLIANPDKLFIWLYKIMYGLNYKEVFLKNDIRNPRSEMIEDGNRFSQISSFNLFPKFACGEIHFDGFSPYSIFIFSLTDTPTDRFYYVDEPYKLYSSIIIDKIGIVCSFQCDGYIERDIVNRVGIKQGSLLALPEFGDFSSFVLHLKARMKMLPNYLCKSINGCVVFRKQPSDDSNRYSDFDPNIMADYTKKLFEPLFSGLIMKDENGELAMKYKSPFTYF